MTKLRKKQIQKEVKDLNEQMSGEEPVKFAIELGALTLNLDTQDRKAEYGLFCDGLIQLASGLKIPSDSPLGELVKKIILAPMIIKGYDPEEVKEAVKDMKGHGKRPGGKDDDCGCPACQLRRALDGGDLSELLNGLTETLKEAKISSNDTTKAHKGNDTVH